MLMFLNRSEIVKNSPYKILEPEALSECLDKIYKRSEEIHLLASIILYTLPKEKFIENPLASSLCITDAFLRKNKKKISLGYVTEPGINKTQQITKTVATLFDIVHDKISLGEIRNWFLWHVIDSRHEDETWDFYRDEKDLLVLLSRFTSNAYSSKK